MHEKGMGTVICEIKTKYEKILAKEKINLIRYKSPYMSGLTVYIDHRMLRI